MRPLEAVSEGKGAVQAVPPPRCCCFDLMHGRAKAAVAPKTPGVGLPPGTRSAGVSSKH